MNSSTQRCSDSCSCAGAPSPDGRTSASSGVDRRRFVEIAALGSGASMLGVARAKSAASSATEALLLSCMDYRLMDDVEQHMSDIGLEENYDHVVLAGASLGAVTTRYPAWNQTFWDHLGIALQLHSIRRVVLLDHRDCGAYNVILGKEHAATREIERQSHEKQLLKLAAQIHSKYPALKVEAKLMDLDGKVETIVVPSTQT